MWFLRIMLMWILRHLAPMSFLCYRYVMITRVTTCLDLFRLTLLLVYTETPASFTIKLCAQVSYFNLLNLNFFISNGLMSLAVLLRGLERLRIHKAIGITVGPGEQMSHKGQLLLNCFSDGEIWSSASWPSPFKLIALFFLSLQPSR